MPEFQHRFAHTNGIRMHYVEAGSGPLVILCHGFPESWYSWRHQLRALADHGYRVVAPDQRGYGETDAPAAVESYTLCHLTADIVGLLYDLKQTRAVIIGHDWGSAVASTCALVRPDLFTAAALLSVPYLPGFFGGARPTELMQRIEGDTLNFYQAYFQQPDLPEAELGEDVQRTLLGLFASGAAGSSTERRWKPTFSISERFIDSIPLPESMPSWLTPGDLEYYTHRFTTAGFGGPLNWYRNLDRNAELLAFLKNARLRQPSLYVAGESDAVLELYRDAYDALEQTMPGLWRKMLIPDAGHWVQQEQPERVNEILLNFLAEPRVREAGA